jgi:hypothetical protein
MCGLGTDLKANVRIGDVVGILASEISGCISYVIKMADMQRVSGCQRFYPNEFVSYYVDP